MLLDGFQRLFRKGFPSLQPVLGAKLVVGQLDFILATIGDKVQKF